MTLNFIIALNLDHSPLKVSHTFLNSSITPEVASSSHCFALSFLLLSLPLSLFSPLHPAVQLIYSQKTKSTVGSFRFRRLVPCSLTTTPNSSASRESHYEGEAMLPTLPCGCVLVFLAAAAEQLWAGEAETERPGRGGRTGSALENGVCLRKQKLQGLGARF